MNEQVVAVLVTISQETWQIATTRKKMDSVETNSPCFSNHPIGVEIDTFRPYYLTSGLTAVCATRYRHLHNHR